MTATETVRREWEEGNRRLEELAAAYVRADDWARAAVGERAATPGWPRTLAIVQDAAFHMYQRGAVDYTP